MEAHDAEEHRQHGPRLAREIGEDRPAGSVTAEELHELVANGIKPMRNGKVIEGQETSRKMRANYAAALRGMFAYALTEGWVEEDPAAGLPAYRARKKRAGDPLRREEYLTPDELRAIVAELRKGDPDEPNRSQPARDQDATMTLVMGMAGLRPGEAIALRWEDVDFSRVAAARRLVACHGRDRHAEEPRRPRHADGRRGLAGARRARRYART